MLSAKVDVPENDILEMSPDLLNTLLKDHTLSTEDKQVNIFWATDNYADRGKGCKAGDIRTHNGTYALINDWGAPKAKQEIRFIDLMK